MEPYYYNHLPKSHQTAYHAIKTGLLSLASSFSVPRLENRELTDIFFKLRLDCPDIFFGVGFHYRFYPDSLNVEMIPEYIFDKSKIKEHQKAMTSRIAKLVRPAMNMTEWDKELYIHDFICSNIIYDKLKKPYSHEIIGPLGHGVGVCEGIAKTVKILCDALGIWCIIAISDSNPDKGIKYRHAWNIVRINGEYYHMDATFDNTLGHGTVLRYDYVNLADKQILRDHEPVLYPVPICTDGVHTYYSTKKLCFTKTEEIEKRAQQYAKKGTSFLFQWKGGYLNKDIMAEILSSLERGAKQKGKHARVSLNWQQAVFQAIFVEDMPIEEVVVEQANEGEIEYAKENID